MPHLLNPSLEGHLGCFQSLAIVNSATINMGVQVPLSYSEVHSFGYKARNNIAGLYGSSIFSFFEGPLHYIP
jgi:hypothetical protein